MRVLWLAVAFPWQVRSLRFIRMMSNNEQRRYARGEALFREGEDAHEMYIITSGHVQVRRAHPHPHEPPPTRAESSYGSGSNGRRALLRLRAHRT